MQGEDQKKLDLVANEVFKNSLRRSGQCCILVGGCLGHGSTGISLRRSGQCYFPANATQSIVCSSRQQPSPRAAALLRLRSRRCRRAQRAACASNPRLQITEEEDEPIFIEEPHR